MKLAYLGIAFAAVLLAGCDDKSDSKLCDNNNCLGVGIYHTDNTGKELSIMVTPHGSIRLGYLDESDFPANEVLHAEGIAQIATNPIKSIDTKMNINMRTLYGDNHGQDVITTAHLIVPELGVNYGDMVKASLSIPEFEIDQTFILEFTYPFNRDSDKDALDQRWLAAPSTPNGSFEYYPSSQQAIVVDEEGCEHQLSVKGEKMSPSIIDGSSPMQYFSAQMIDSTCKMLDDSAGLVTLTESINGHKAIEVKVMTAHGINTFNATTFPWAE